MNNKKWTCPVCGTTYSKDVKACIICIELRQKANDDKDKFEMLLTLKKLKEAKRKMRENNPFQFRKDDIKERLKQLEKEEKKIKGKLYVK